MARGSAPRLASAATAALTARAGAEEGSIERAGLAPVEISTTTPVDPGYVTARNMRSARDLARVAIWHVGKALEMGSMLVAWAARRRDAEIAVEAAVAK